MKIVLDDNFSVDGDHYNWTLNFEEKRTEPQKDGTSKEITSKSDWHYPTLADCLNKYADQSLKPCESVLAVMVKIDELKEIISNLKQ